MRKYYNQEFPHGSAVGGSGIVTATALVTAVAQVQFLARELPGIKVAGKKKGGGEREKNTVNREFPLWFSS